MSRSEKFIGAMVVMATASDFVSMVIQCVAENLSIGSVMLAIAQAWVGCLAVASVWRDRL